MSKSRKKFTAEERLPIVQEPEWVGQIETVRNYSVAPFLFDRWRMKHLSEGSKGLKPKYTSLVSTIFGIR